MQDYRRANLGRSPQALASKFCYTVKYSDMYLVLISSISMWQGLESNGHSFSAELQYLQHLCYRLCETLHFSVNPKRPQLNQRLCS